MAVETWRRRGLYSPPAQAEALGQWNTCRTDGRGNIMSEMVRTGKGGSSSAIRTLCASCRAAGCCRSRTGRGQPLLMNEAPCGSRERERTAYNGSGVR
jgi:hypothetical protein